MTQQRRRRDRRSAPRPGCGYCDCYPAEGSGEPLTCPRCSRLFVLLHSRRDLRLDDSMKVMEGEMTFEEYKQKWPT